MLFYEFLKTDYKLLKLVEVSHLKFCYGLTFFLFKQDINDHIS